MEPSDEQPIERLEAEIESATRTIEWCRKFIVVSKVMMAMGGRVNGGLYGTAPSLNPAGNGNGTLENNGADVTFETDFRSVYARVIDNWLGANSVSIHRRSTSTAVQ